MALSFRRVDSGVSALGNFSCHLYFVRSAGETLRLLGDLQVALGEMIM